MTVNQGEVHISMPTATPNPWNVQLSQPGLAFAAGESYTLRVTAYAERNRTINAQAGLAEAPWTAYGRKTPNLSTTPQTFGISFTMSVDQRRGRIALDLGRFAGDVLIEKVSLVRVEP